MKAGTRLLCGWLLLAAGCADPELELRVAELETELAEVKEQLAQRPAAAAAAPKKGPNDPDAKAAADLYRAANLAAGQGNTDEAKAKIKEIADKYPGTPAARNAQQLGAELEILGMQAGGMDVDRWYQGKMAGLDSGTSLLVFWEVWCPHCKREVPKLEQTHQKFGPKGLKVVGLTKQTRNVTDEQVSDFISTNKITYPIAKEAGSDMSKRFAVSGIPAAVVVKDGTIVWRGHPGRLTDDMLGGWL